VVLNSAERAPYLLYIEVIKDDLDFDPAKRANKDILRKLIAKEGGPKHRWSESGPPLSSLPKSTPRLNIADSNIRTPYTFMTQTPLLSLPTAASSTSTFSDADEEVDLVEQIYGADQPLRSKMLDIEDSIVLPPTPKNKELDMVAWSRATLPLMSDDAGIQIQQSHSRSPSVSRAPSSTPAASALPAEPETRALSLDEYSERMRTAAVMLAQLNMDQARDPSTHPQKSDGSPNPGPIRHSRK
jgi:phosphatidylinositol 4-kinase